MDESPFTCARCAAVNPTCCRTSPENSARCFPLSEAEKERLAPYAASLGVPAAEIEENTAEFLNLLRVLFPDKKKELSAAFPLGGAHLRLPLSSAGDCLFLRDDGCFLPRCARPWYCQLFPIWVSHNAFDRFQPEACLLTSEARRLPEVFAALGLSREEVKSMYLSLCRDWGLGT